MTNQENTFINETIGLPEPTGDAPGLRQNPRIHTRLTSILRGRPIKPEGSVPERTVVRRQPEARMKRRLQWLHKESKHAANEAHLARVSATKKTRFLHLHKKIKRTHSGRPVYESSLGIRVRTGVQEKPVGNISVNAQEKSSFLPVDVSDRERQQAERLIKYFLTDYHTVGTAMLEVRAAQRETDGMLKEKFLRRALYQFLRHSPAWKELGMQHPRIDKIVALWHNAGFPGAEDFGVKFAADQDQQSMPEEVRMRIASCWSERHNPSVSQHDFERALMAFFADDHLSGNGRWHLARIRQVTDANNRKNSLLELFRSFLLEHKEFGNAYQLVNLWNETDFPGAELVVPGISIHTSDTKFDRFMHKLDMLMYKDTAPEAGQN